MSMIVHRCQTCRRADFQHRDGWHCRAKNYGPPELIPTWSSGIQDRGAPITEVLPPGVRLAAGGKGGKVEACDCAACQQLYTELTGETLT